MVVGSGSARDVERAENVVHLTDLHAGGDGVSGELLLDLMRVVAATRRENPALTVVTGDVVNCAMRTYFDGDRPDVTDYEIVRVIERKNWFVLPGNHEYNWAGPAGTAEFERRIGPRHGVRDAAGWRFIGVDFGFPYTDQAFVPPEELRWLEEKLSEAGGTPCAVCVHHPPWMILNGEILLPVLKRYPVRLILAGHTHKNGVSLFGGVPVVVTGAATGGWYSVISFRGGRVDLAVRNALDGSTPACACTLRDADGRANPAGTMAEAGPRPAARTGAARRTVHRAAEAAIHIPPSRRGGAVAFCDAVGICRELLLPPAGDVLDGALFQASLRTVCDLGGETAFPFHDDGGRACFLSVGGRVVLPDGEMDLGRIVSCAPVVRGNLLAAGTLRGAVVFCDTGERKVLGVFDPGTLLSVSAMASDGERVLAASMDETLRAFAWDGRPLWRTRISDINYAYSVYASAPVVGGGVVVLTALPDRVAAFSAADGARLWERRIGPCHTFTPIPWDGGAGPGRFVVGDRSGILRAFDAATGAETVLAEFPGREIVAGTARGGAVFLNCRNGAVLRWSPEGVRAWEYDVPAYLTDHAPIPLEREVLLPCRNGGFLSFRSD